MTVIQTSKNKALQAQVRAQHLSHSGLQEPKLICFIDTTAMAKQKPSSLSSAATPSPLLSFSQACLSSSQKIFAGLGFQSCGRQL